MLPRSKYPMLLILGVLLTALAVAMCLTIYQNAPVAALKGNYSYAPIDSDQERRTGLAAESLVPLSKISIPMIIAVVSMEDGDFLTHKGFDISEIAGSLKDSVSRGERLRGASTISR